jgi:hypothetical protein
MQQFSVGFKNYEENNFGGLPQPVIAYLYKFVGVTLTSAVSEFNHVKKKLVFPNML